MTLKQKIFWITIGIILSVGILTFGSPEQDKPLIIDQNIERDRQESALPIKDHSYGTLSAHTFEFSISEVTPMTVDDQFIKRVLKHGIDGREPEFMCKATKAEQHTCYKQAVIHDRLN